jgi:hypothetical protein
MPDLDNGFEPQDEAEAFDETHSVDELDLGADESENDPDIAADVYDVTSALGDADEDEDDGETADDYDDAELRALDLDDEESEDEDDDDGLDDDLEDAPDYDARAGLDRMIDRTAERGAPIEPGLVYTSDLDAITYPRDDDVEKYESTRPLSDEQLADLGYLDRPQTKETTAMNDKKPTPDTVSDANKDGRDWEDRSFSVDPETALVEGSGASADDVAKEHDPDEEDRLDEGLEETFPASDPVSAKHIT